MWFTKVVWIQKNELLDIDFYFRLLNSLVGNLDLLLQVYLPRRVGVENAIETVPK